MAIASLADYAAAPRQQVRLFKSNVGASGAQFSSWTSTGTPGAGGSAGNTANGAVPTNATTGAPSIIPFSGSGYISAVIDAHSSIGGRHFVGDRVFHCGAYSGNASQTLASQPSFSSRVPGGTDYTGVRIWYEALTNAGGSPSLTVTYTNESGTTGRSTGAIAVNSLGAGVATSLPLQAGDSGVSKIETVAMTGATGGTWNVVLFRPLILLPLLANTPLLVPLETVGLAQFWQDSCLMVFGIPLNSNAHVIDLVVEVASG